MENIIFSTLKKIVVGAVVGMWHLCIAFVLMALKTLLSLLMIYFILQAIMKCGRLLNPLKMWFYRPRHLKTKKVHPLSAPREKLISPITNPLFARSKNV